MNPYTLPDGNVQIAFSGGRTSAYMLHQILEANGDLPDRVVTLFCNTGREMPETLDFIQECADRWGAKVVWLEYQREYPLYKMVSHNSASRDGKPFEELIRKKGIVPNRAARFCTIEMKIHTPRRYLVGIGWERWVSATGIRADEPRRVRERLSVVEGTRQRAWQPLADAGVSRHDVADFWRKQSFDLQLPNIDGNCWLGNCDGCFLKSEANLAALARDYPERHQWWQDMEDMASEWTLGNGAQFRREYSRRELRWMVDNQGDWIFDAEDALCQANEGECFG